MSRLVRRRWSETVKLEILDRQQHLCALCGKSLSGATSVEYDHALALGLEGEDDPDNLCAVHAHCHKAKTAGDVAKIAKAARQGGKTGQRARRLTGAPRRKIESRGFER